MHLKWADTTNIFTRPYWRYQYKKLVKPGAEISLEEFRTLMLLKRVIDRQDERKELARRIRHLPIRILNVLVDLTQSRMLEDYRQQLVREFTLFLYRQYLEINKEVDGEPYIIHLDRLDVMGSIVIAHITHSVGKKQHVQRDIKAILNYYFKIPKKEINIQKVGRGELKVIFSVNR